MRGYALQPPTIRSQPLGEGPPKIARSSPPQFRGEEKEQVPLHPSDACAVLPQGNLAACPSSALSNVRTSSIPDRTCPNSNFASAMMMPRAAAISRPAFIDRARHQLQLEIA